MIHVGFVNVFAVREWLGGLNYLRNLLQALLQLDNRRIEPLLFTGSTLDTAIAREFSFMPVRHLRMLDRGNPLWLLRKAFQHGLGRDLLLQQALAAEGVSVLSHSGDLGRGATIPCVAWVPDLQHRHLKRLFSDAQAALRETQIQRALGSCARLIVSSESAARELRASSPQHADRIRVLRFATGLFSAGNLPGKDELRSRYGIDGPYLHLPNQFWAHKNHEVIVEALRVLRDSGTAVTVLATGLTEDPRQPGHFEQLMRRVRDLRLDELFRPLGVVPYRDMLGLMRHCVAVVNPSRFEGWSTSVEEARSMGKAIVLSSIGVHREQNPARGIFFETDDVQDAARAIREAWTAFDTSHDEAAVAAAAKELPQRMRRFAEDYQAIVLEVVEPAHG